MTDKKGDTSLAQRMFDTHNRMTDDPTRQEEYTAYHEAGHVLQAYVSGEFVCAHIFQRSSTCGETNYKTKPEKMEDINRSMKCFVAGPLSELYYRKWMYGENIQIKDVASDDYSRARYRFRSSKYVPLTNFYCDKEFLEYLKYIEEEVSSFLKER